MQTELRSTGRFETEKASKYLQQLCKHFAHKREVRFDETAGEVALPTGPCHLRAEAEALRVEVTAADAAQLQRARGIIDSHLERFAFREAFAGMEWRGGGVGEAA
jgi:hypothetical protein